MKTIALVSVVSPMYDTPNFNLGLAELAGYLRHKNPELKKKGAITFIEPDITFARTPSLSKSAELTVLSLLALKPDIIGLSAKIGSQDNLKAILDLLSPFVKGSWCPTIVVGNVVSTFSYDQLAPQYPGVLFCRGDGELTMDAIYNDIQRKSVPNIAYYSNGTLFETHRDTLNHGEQYWLPAFDTLKSAIKQKADIALRSTTGCSKHCTFCSIPHLSVKSCGSRMGWESYPVERTIDSLKVLKNTVLKWFILPTTNSEMLIGTIYAKWVTPYTKFVTR